MYKYFWKYFPVFYVLPFLMATTQTGLMTQVGEYLRWCLLVIGCCLAFKFGFKRRPRQAVRLYRTDAVILSFIGLFLASAAWSIAPALTVGRTISLLLLYICSFWVMWRYANQFSEDVLVRNLLYTIAVFLAVNLLVGTLFFPDDLLSSRFKGLFQSPNNIGLIACLAVPLAVARWLRSRKKIDLVVAGVVGLNLILAGSRSAMLGVAIAVVAIIVSLFASRPKKAIVIGITGIMIVASFSQSNYFNENVLRADTLENASNRTFFWDLSKRYTKNQPYTGHGFGTDGIIHEYYGVDLKRMGLRGYGVMSSYYGLAVAMGWPVTLAFFGLLGGFIVISIVRFWTDFYLVTLIATTASGMIVSIFEPAIYSAGNCFSFLFWVCFMLIVRRLKHMPRHRGVVRSVGSLPKRPQMRNRLA